MPAAGVKNGGKYLGRPWKQCQVVRVANKEHGIHRIKATHSHDSVSEVWTRTEISIEKLRKVQTNKMEGLFLLMEHRHT